MNIDKFLLHLPDIIQVFRELVDRLLKDMTGQVVYLAKPCPDGKVRLNIRKIQSLLKRYGLEHRLYTILREVGYSKIGMKSLKAIFTKTAEYSQGISLFIQRLRLEGYLTRQDLVKIRDELERDYCWYKTQIDALKRLLAQ